MMSLWAGRVLDPAAVMLIRTDTLLVMQAALRERATGEAPPKRGRSPKARDPRPTRGTPKTKPPHKLITF